MRSGLDIYRYGRLLAADTPGAEAHNAPLLGPRTLGIEVTEPALAGRCGLGNIDPQHGPGAEPGAPAAIEAAVGWPPPPAGATLVTVRPDLDALGAMAVLGLRGSGMALTDQMVARVNAAGRADRFDRGPWPGPCELPGRPEELCEVYGDSVVTAMAAACADDELAIAERVRIAADWLARGRVPPSHSRAPRERAEHLVRGLRNCLITVRPAAGGRIALVTSEVAGALRLGYCVAPVVIACNPAHPFAAADGTGAPGRKYTIAQYAPGHADLDAAAAALDRLESGWGGSQTIKGSPQGAPSALDLGTVIEAVARHLA